MKKKQRCYWTDCKERPAYKWYPSKNPGSLLVCETHYCLLTQVHEVKVVKQGHTLTYVEVVPEPTRPS